MGARIDKPGTWSPVDYPLACTRLDDNGKPCHGRPVPGDDRCAKHYGKLDSKMKARRERLVAQWVGKDPVDMKAITAGDEEAMFLGAPRNIDPGVALLEEIHRAAGHVKWLEYKVRGLTDETLVWGQIGQTEEEGYDAKGAIANVKKEFGAGASQWYQLYLEERKHLFKVSEAALRAGVEERRVRLAERGVDMLEAAISAAFTDMGIDPNSTRARDAIGKRLREALEGPSDMFGYSAGGDAVKTAQAVSAPKVLEGQVVQAEEW